MIASDRYNRRCSYYKADKRTQGFRTKGLQEQSVKVNLPKGGLTLRLETIGQKTGEREGVKQTTALSALRRARADELQHGAVRYSTPATHMPQHGTHDAVRTPRSYNTAQCPDR